MYRVAIYSYMACSITTVYSYHHIPLYNELMITSRPNVVMIPLSRDFLIISYKTIAMHERNLIYATEIKNWPYTTNQWLLHLYMQHKPYLLQITGSLLCYRAWVFHLIDHKLVLFHV